MMLLCETTLEIIPVSHFPECECINSTVRVFFLNLEGILVHSQRALLEWRVFNLASAVLRVLYTLTHFTLKATP